MQQHRPLIPYAGHEDFNAGEADEPVLPLQKRRKPHRYNKRNEQLKHLPDQYIGT